MFDMRKSLLTAFSLLLVAGLYAQNTGIGTLNPQRTFHVGGGMRVDTLAGAGNGFISFNNVGDLIPFSQSGNVLHVLRGDGTWGSPGYQAANNTILISGNLIGGNYQAANNTLLLSGNQISGNYQAANSTLLFSGNQVSGNYQAANNTLLLSGNQISGNYQAGTGINITGNVISSTGNNLWVTDPNGIHNQSGNVGIGTNAEVPYTFLIQQPNYSGTGGGLLLRSADVWHTFFVMTNTTTGLNNSYSFSHGGSLNHEVGPRNFGIVNHNSAKFSLIINGASNNIGIGMNNITNAEAARSRLHVFSGDINIDEIGSGIILKSPNGQCWRITIDNGGNLLRTAITCP
jgi:hypothetical protein